MVYKKRRYTTKKNKTKRFNKYAYAKTDSKNQAKQIVQLNKKISNVYKALKPEIIKSYSSGVFNISNASAYVLPLDTMVGLTAEGKLYDLFKGNYTKFIYFNFKFFFNSGNIDLTQGKTLRVIIFQNRNGIDTVPVEGDIFQDSAAILSSFKEGINNNYKILLNKLYTISSDKDYLYRMYNFKKLIGYNKLAKNTSAVSKYGRGSIFIMFLTTQATEFAIRWNASLGRVDTNI